MAGKSLSSSESEIGDPFGNIPSGSDMIVGKVFNINRDNIKRPKKFQTPVPVFPVRLRRRLEQKYFTKGRKDSTPIKKDLHKEPSPYKYSDLNTEISQNLLDRFNTNLLKAKELKKSICRKQKIKNTINKDIYDRLYVDVPYPDAVKTVTDYDNEYWKLVQGRPFKEQFNLRKYIQTVRDTLRTKVLIGYREDDIMLINQNLLNEQKTIQEIKKNYQAYVKTFDSVLAKDHISAKLMLDEAEKASAKLFDAKLNLKQIDKKVQSVKAQVCKTEKQWNTVKMHQKFLFMLSPSYWKKENKDQVKGYDIVDQLSAQEEEEMFQEFRHSLADSSFTVLEMIRHIRSECQNNTIPKLYFTDPNQLIEIFTYMEMQNLNYLLHAEELAVPLEHIEMGMEQASVTFDKQIKSFNQSVHELSKAIEWEENKGQELESMAMLLIYNQFKDIIMSDDVLNLYVFVEDVFEEVIGPNDASLGILDMMNYIEQKYRKEVLQLDQLPQELVTTLEGSCLNEKFKAMKLAAKAAKQFMELDLMTRSLKKAFAPKYVKELGKEMKPRSKVKAPVKKVTQVSRLLTEAEEEYLEYFTDFCSNTDDPKDYGINQSSDPEVKHERTSETKEQTFKQGPDKNSVVEDEESLTLLHRTKSRLCSKVKGIDQIEKVVFANI